MISRRASGRALEVLKRWLTAVDLFCGSGAVTEALKRRHFRVVAAIDNDPVACATYRSNHPRVTLFQEDIRRVKPKIIRDELLKGRNLDLLVVCAPCQPFSSQNRQKGNDTRAELILQAARFARALKPAIIFFENVPGLASPSNSKLLARLRRRLPPSYTLTGPVRVDAADYGVPQRRIRCIMFASRNVKLPTIPAATSPEGKRVTVRHAIQGLIKLKTGQRAKKDPLHFARTHQAIALKRLAAIPKDGGSRSALPRELALGCHAGHKGHPDVYGRMKWDDIAPTLTTGCTDVTKGRFAHPADNRAITLREAALLQTFPDCYNFEGRSGQIAIQIGNAVPMKLMDALLPSMRQAMRS